MKRELKAIAFLVIIFLTSASFTSEAQSRKDKKTDTKEVSDLNADFRKSEYYLTEAEKYFILEDYAKAFVLYQKALEQDKDNATAYYKISQIYQKSEEFDKALTNAITAVELSPENKYFYLQLAEIHTKQNNYQSAIDTYLTMFEKCEDANEYYFELAALYIFQEEYLKAINIYDKIENIYGLNDQVSSQKQKLYIQLGDLEGTIKEGEKLINAFPGEPEYVIALSEILISNNKNDIAKKYLESFLIEFDEKSPRIKLLLSDIYKKAGQHEKAKKYLQDAFSSPDLDFLTKLKVMNTLMQQLPNKDVEALSLELVNILIETHPDEADAYAVSGDLNMQLEKNQEAIDRYKTAIDKGANNYNIWHNVIRLSYMQSEFDEVVSLSEEAIEYYPNQVFLYFFLGTAHLANKSYDEAVETLELGKSLAGSNDQLNSTINAQLGDAYHYLKEFQKSDESYEEALAFNPNNDHVLNNYSYFLSLRKEKLDLAVKMSSKLVKRNPDNATYLDTHAWVLYMQDKYKEARYYIEKAIDSGNDVSGTIIEHYGDILFKLGEVDSAVKQWQKAKGMDETSDLIDKKIADRKLYE